MVTRKPVPLSPGDAPRIPAFPVSSTQQPEESSTNGPTNQRSPYLNEESESNPWEDVQRPTDSSEEWDHISQPAVSKTAPAQQQHEPTLNDRPDLSTQVRTGLRTLTPQSSWEKDDDSSDEETQTKASFTAPSHAPPAPPAHAPPPPPPVPGLNNPFRAKSTERVPQVSVAKDEDSSHIWAEIAQDKPVQRPTSIPVAELDGLRLQESGGWESVPNPVAAPVIPPISSLIDLDHGDEYKQELEATPFGPAKGLEDLDQGKGKGKSLVSTDDDFQPPSGPPPSKAKVKYNDRKITVPDEVANKQRSETYQIKHIRWADSNSNEIRTSPILIQNKNGPCPLMALVNALTLSTPPDLNTALIETLRVRERISLGLLLDAVFDELMSGRRGNAAQGLPDVAELYAFLITLHTGMNVNPRFIINDQQQSLLDDHPVAEQNKPGSFEDTKEMMLYGTFSIPLIHGWLLPRSHAAYASIERSATTYEDAQNLMFREEELEDKIRSSGLNPQEQQLFEDISSIKYFLSSTATQLTGYGLNTINQSLAPGSIAILFRNDHFSTLYKQPRTGQLLILVTDAGYATHDEIVWESLIDVSGEGSEFFSGDFRPVGGNPTQSQAFEQNSSSGDWTAVQRNKGRRGANGIAVNTNKPMPHDSNQHPGSPSTRDHEQEDADLALAMQLQEEEEEASRRTSAQRRQQEEEASSQYLQQNGGQAANNSRNTGRRTSQNVTPLLPPRRNTAQANPRPAVHREQADDDAPPSYEQASQAEPYHGPDISQTSIATGASQASSSRPVSQRHRGQSAYSLNNTIGGYPGSSADSRRRSGAPTTPIGVTTRRRDSNNVNERDKDCIVM